MTRHAIPETPLAEDALFQSMLDYRREDLDWKNGRAFGYVFHAGEELDRIAKRAFSMFMSENGLDPTAFRSLQRFENEILEMAKSHLHAPEEAVGSFTSGGTESVLLAVKTARDHAKSTASIASPEIVLPVTAHASFFKAAHYFRLKTVVVDVDPDTCCARPELIEAATTENTVLLVASAPSYAHGCIDPIEEIGAIAERKNILFHVDGCIGAFLLPYFERASRPIPKFDFRVPGVTSLSMDLHKYAYCPKGASVLLHRSRDLRRHQIYACAEWAGYSLVNTTIQSTKGGGPLAAAWAVMNYLGEPGYTRLAAAVIDTTDRIRQGLEAHPELHIVGRPDMSLLAFTSDTVDVFHLVDAMNARGWYVQAQLARAGVKESVHLTVMPANAAHVDAFFSDLDNSIDEVRGKGPGPLVESLKTSLANLDVSTLTPSMFRQMLEMAGLTGTEEATGPKKMAEVNHVLNRLPAPMTNALLVEFMNELYR